MHGILVVDKPSGLTSHTVVSHVRRAFGTRRVGHAGTLDPMATGVLVILLGEATKLSSVLSTEKKTYEARVQFGCSTDSLDADGLVTKRVELPPDWLGKLALEPALQQERSRRLQIPPQVSAIKVGGQKAYDRARRGETTELVPRDVKVHQLSIIEDGKGSLPPCGSGPNQLALHVAVSKGYYVRSLARDLGDALGAPAHLSQLRRIQSGPFSIDQATSWPVSADAPLKTLGAAARLSLPTATVTPEGAERLRQGKRINLEHFVEGPPLDEYPPLLAVFYKTGLIALIEPSDHGEFRVKRGINDPFFDGKDLPPVPSGA